MADAARPALSIADSARLTRIATSWSVAVATLLILLKGWALLATGSVAILASLADSGLDLVASLITFGAVRYAASDPDEEHRFGHGKAEAFASLTQAGLVFASAALIGREAFGRLTAPTPVSNEGWAVAVMAVSMVATAVLVAVQTRILRQVASVGVEGDRAHYVADFLSNGLALAGLAAVALTDQTWMDAAAGLAVAAWLLWGAIKVFRGAATQLMDRELPDADRTRIVQILAQDGRIEGVHELRTRASGPRIHIQLHAEMDPELSLKQAHDVMEAAEDRLYTAFPNADVIIHPDPKGYAEPHGPFGEERLVGVVWPPHPAGAAAKG